MTSAFDLADGSLFEYTRFDNDGLLRKIIVSLCFVNGYPVPQLALRSLNVGA